MKHLTELNINITPNIRSLGFGIIRYVAVVEYAQEGSMFREEYNLSPKDGNLDEFFASVASKASELEVDQTFGEIKQIQ